MLWSLTFHEIPPHENLEAEDQTLEEGVGNPACSLEEEENEGGMVEGHGHSRVDVDHHNQGGRVGGADTVLVGMAVVLVAPPVIKKKIKKIKKIKKKNRTVLFQERKAYQHAYSPKCSSYIFYGSS